MKQFSIISNKNNRRFKKELRIIWIDKNSQQFGGKVVLEHENGYFLLGVKDGKPTFELMKTIFEDAFQHFYKHKEGSVNWPAKSELESLKFNDKEVDLELFRAKKFNELFELALTSI